MAILYKEFHYVLQIFKSKNKRNRNKYYTVYDRSAEPAEAYCGTKLLRKFSSKSLEPARKLVLLKKKPIETNLFRRLY